MDAGVTTGLAATAWLALSVPCAGSLTSEGAFSEVIISESVVAHTPAYEQTNNIVYKKAGNSFFIIIYEVSPPYMLAQSIHGTEMPVRLTIHVARIWQ